MRRPLPFSILALSLLLGCGTWVGNPKDPDDDEDEETQPPQIAGPGGPGGNASMLADPGEVFLQRVSLRAGTAFTSQFAFGGAMLAGNDVDKSGPFELSIVRADGSEAAYRRGERGNTVASFLPEADGEFTVLLKSNASQPFRLETANALGAAAATTPESADDRVDAPYRNVHLKAVVAFARQCKRTSADGNSTDTFTAPEGSYYVQPHVFLGLVGGDRRVTPLSSATVRIEAGGTVIPLTRIGDLPLASYREHHSLSQAEHAAYTRSFYQGYFGGAGELYTVDTFRFGGDCANAKTIALGADVGTADVRLVVEDGSLNPPLAGSYPVRATLSTAFSTYTAAGEKLNDWTQCTYDRLTGNPKTYNGDASTCKTLRLSDPPYVTLDYKLPSDGGAVSKASDPTRILYYGHSFAKPWIMALIEGADAFLDGSRTEVTLPTCLSNGGLVAVPIQSDRTYMPLAEFNTAVADVVNLARKAGTHTALPDFFQGNIDASGVLTYPACIPKDGSTCYGMRSLQVTSSSCRVKADSGISATSVGDSFIYPEYFEMSGVIAE